MFTKLELVLMTLFVIVCISLVCEKEKATSCEETAWKTHQTQH